MLILVGVSVNVALNGGLFTTAKEAVERTQIEVDKEQLFSAAIGAIGTDGKVDFDKLDSNLPEGFTGSKGTYTSKAGNTFMVSSDGSIEHVPSVKELQEKYKFGYYSSLPKAIADANNGTTGSADVTQENAVAGIYEDENGNTSVILLKDTTVTEGITISADMTLNLGGKALSFGERSGYNLTFMASENSSITTTIDGRIIGSTIQSIGNSGTNLNLIRNDSTSTLTIIGGKYIIDGDYSDQANVINSKGNLTVKNAEISCDNENTDGYTRSVIVRNNSSINNCVLNISGYKCERNEVG